MQLPTISIRPPAYEPLFDEQGKGRNACRGSRVFYALLLLSLGCTIGFAMATWGPEGLAVSETCLARFDTSPQESTVLTVTVSAAPVATSRPEVEVWDRPSSWPMDALELLNGPPTAAFKDNLKKGVNYITTFPGSGWTNDVILYMNLLYLALITDRVPVIPFFTPTHVGLGLAPTLLFGEVFDIPRLQRALGLPILEWHQVKDIEKETVDSLGCWSVWKAVQTFNREPHATSFPSRFKLDVSYTTPPRWVAMAPEDDDDKHASFWSLASLAFPETRSQIRLEIPTISPLLNQTLPPDEQMLCLDYLYYVGVKNRHEWESDWSPAWRFVGQHMHWTPKIVELADSYVREALLVGPNKPTPPYISVHVRHGDFAELCKGVAIKYCFAPMSAIARRVEEVQNELFETHGIMVDKVIVTSDEEDQAWWKDVTEREWARPNHSRTVELHGLWYPTLIDSAIHSGAIGFVGTDQSTVSIIARKRVTTWNGGVTRTVKWGKENADDHE
ncbi:hypothetical protein FB45DRAFT_837988 [Roridomyces roridus]|uniref:Uncharacterized protein n=1 Tax=Roridomyces roridus TaxID=1738132 RepID=A0AAD7BKB8_9AGAR|nr:hypothetical protein FB45DRAFT_837988 [Roridomyces roridus]